MPEAEECISYSIPAIRLEGRIVAGFAATAEGSSYYPFSGSTLGTPAGELIMTISEREKAKPTCPACKGLKVTLQFAAFVAQARNTG